MTASLVLAGLWVAAIVWLFAPFGDGGGVRFRLRLSARVATLAGAGASGVRPARESRLVGSVGRAVRGMFRRPRMPLLDRRVGRAVIAGGAAAVLSVPLAPVIGGGAWLAGWWHERRGLARAEIEVINELPDLVELLILTVGSGLNVSLAVSQVAERAPPYSARALGAVLDRVDRGERFADALDTLPSLLGEPARPLAAALIDAERYGGALLPALERVSFEVRLGRRRRAEQAVRRIPVTLLFPLVTCVLPAFALLTVAPLIAGALGALRH